ncbi:hypothetical protein [Caballeronia choica]|uniref:hypothetical protein n=1 Tax=Caballeronia choica TaxID=326476 RepID=UPI000F741100|nr:hypothetical protein [Caballeronia choica]
MLRSAKPQLHPILAAHAPHILLVTRAQPDEIRREVLQVPLETMLVQSRDPVFDGFMQDIVEAMETDDLPHCVAVRSRAI